MSVAVYDHSSHSVVLPVCLQPGMSADSNLMKRSFSTIGDQCVNGLWQEQHSLERVSPEDAYRPRQRSYRGHISSIYIYSFDAWFQYQEKL